MFGRYSWKIVILETSYKHKHSIYVQQYAEVHLDKHPRRYGLIFV